jgi:hypothetical protein
MGLLVTKWWGDARNKLTKGAQVIGTVQALVQYFLYVFLTFQTTARREKKTMLD